MSLESLQNPLSQLRVLPRSVNFATATENTPNINDPYYSDTHQYVKNDMCLSKLDDGAYIFLGGESADKTTTLGGTDPSADTNNWISLSKVGANSLSGPVVPTVAGNGGTTQAYTLTLNTLAVPASTTWVVSWQCTATMATGVATAVDFISWKFTAGANIVSVTQLPTVGNSTNSFATSVVLVVPAGATAIVLSGVTGAVNSLAIGVTATSLVAVRLD